MVAPLPLHSSPSFFSSFPSSLSGLDLLHPYLTLLLFALRASDSEPQNAKEAKGSDGAERAGVERVGAADEPRVLVVSERNERDGLERREEGPAEKRGEQGGQVQSQSKCRL